MSKSDPRVAAYGEVDELNACLGLAAAALDGASETLRASLSRVQAELFELGAVLADPKNEGKSVPAPAALEDEIDAWTKELPALESFILPGGAEAAARLHLARAICRRAERSVVALGAAAPAGAVVYLNRLSDHLFTAARWVNARAGRLETPWTPRAARPTTPRSKKA